MLNRLRWQFTLLYVLAAAVLIALIGGSAYGFLAYYFRSSTDLVLRYKVALAYHSAGLPIPADLREADETWQILNPVPTNTPGRQPDDEFESEDDDGGGDDDDERNAQALPVTDDDETYDSELSAVFLLSVDAQGQLLDNPNTHTIPVSPDSRAVAAALLRGSDFRTVYLENGGRMRLFSYRVGKEDNFNQLNNPAVLQAGRLLKDQDRILAQLLAGLAILGAISVVSVGIGSWWLAGRSVRPAQQSWYRQQAFVANASHELRTPLTLLRASAEVARRGMDSTDARYDLLGDILQETDYMSHLVDDLLLLSRLDAGRLKLEHQVVAVPNLLAELVRQMSPVAEARGIHLEVAPSGGVVMADPTRLRQVLLILLDNALRHTSDGGRILLEAQPDGRRVSLVVRDNGVGISAENLSHVFERFYRGTEDRRQHDSGSGLGLSIARGLVEAMRGQITIRSRPGQGTQVILHFPQA